MLKYNSILFYILLAFLPESGMAQTPSDTVCLGDTSLVKYFVSNPESGVMYDWSLDAGGTIESVSNDTLFVKWGNSPGLYRVSVNSSNSFGCNGEESEYWILVQEAPALSLKPGNATICKGGSVTIRANGADSYSWAPSDGLSVSNADTAIAFPETTTTYTVSGKIGSCVASKTITVETTDVPEAEFTFEQTGNYFLQFNSNVPGATSYFWDFGPEHTSSEQNPLEEFPFDGAYTVTLIVENGCGKDTITQTIEVIKLGFSDITGTKVELGPNPVHDQLFLKVNMKHIEGLQLQLFNIVGQQLSGETYPGQPELLIPIDLSTYAKGIYYLQLTQRNQSVTYKIVRQ